MYVVLMLAYPFIPRYCFTSCCFFYWRHNPYQQTALSSKHFVLNGSTNLIQVILAGDHVKITVFGIKAPMLLFQHGRNGCRKIPSHTLCETFFNDR